MLNCDSGFCLVRLYAKTCLVDMKLFLPLVTFLLPPFMLYVNTFYANKVGVYNLSLADALISLSVKHPCECYAVE